MDLINFRDFGGQQTRSGQHVRRDRLYRCGHLGDLGHGAVEQLLAMDFATVIDLRYVEERQKERSPWPVETLDRVIAHEGRTDSDAPHLQIFAAAMAGNASIDNAYLAFYRQLPFDSLYRPLFASALGRIAQGGARVLVHCTAGKDRTGTFVALLLDLLGVRRDEIVQDYMRSLKAEGFTRLRGDVRARLSDDGLGPAPNEAQIDALIGVKPAYIAAVFGSVETACGSAEAYFRDGGVQPEVISSLRSALLEP